MTLDGILKAAAGGGVVILLLTVVEISRIKINPWSAIGNFFKWLLDCLGRAANSDVLVKLDEVTNAQQEAQKKLETLEQRLDKHILTDARQDADKHRMEILQFNNSLLRNRRHTKEEFIEILTSIDAYEAYCESDKDYPNNRPFWLLRTSARSTKTGSRNMIFWKMGGETMSNDQFIEKCKAAVRDYFNNRADKTDSVVLGEDDVYVVWLCKTLQNNKALLSTTVSDGMYYEVTYNGDKHEMYVDAYKKWENFVVKV